MAIPPDPFPVQSDEEEEGSAGDETTSGEDATPKPELPSKLNGEGGDSLLPDDPDEVGGSLLPEGEEMEDEEEGGSLLPEGEAEGEDKDEDGGAGESLLPTDE